MEKKSRGAILITGGAGYIGSHLALKLVAEKYRAVLIDNFSNSKPEVIQSIRALTRQDTPIWEGDVRDQSLLEDCIRRYEIESVFHLAGMKSVSESVSNPTEYYDNNVIGALCVIKAMQTVGIKKILFSSSATVYGQPLSLPITEAHPATRAESPYGKTKQIIESMLADLAVSEASWEIAVLRYFNPVGAHPSGKLGEDPFGLPGNLLPIVVGAARGALPEVIVYGNDYDTSDGTGVRDYVHVMDLVAGHLAAHEFVSQHGGIHHWNLGTGTGHSVLEVINTFETATGVTVPWRFGPRRSGDVATSYADPSKAAKELDWRADKDLKDMVLDSWRWQVREQD